jgi:AcrR family transcriptional regulator
MQDMSGSVKSGPAPGARGSDARRDRWNAHRARRRQRFVDAALRVLERDGPELLMDAVAAEAGVTKPVLYRYFSDKAELVEALAERGSQILVEVLVPAISASGPALASVRDGVNAYFEVIERYPNLYWLLARHAQAGDGSGPVRRSREFIATALTSVIADYLWLFGMDSGAAEPWAYGITGLVQSTGEWWLRRRSMSRARVVEYVTRVIWAAMSGLLREAGVEVDPAEPLPPARPRPALRPLAGSTGPGADGKGT